MSTVLGVDACPGGWFAVILREGKDPGVACHETFDDLWEAHRGKSCILVDIPIGLPEEGTRDADQEARDLLGCRGSSVFDTICRPLLEMEDYDDANAKYRELAGKGLSQQAWNLREKMKQVDEVVSRDDRGKDVLRESHPELCFYALNDGNPVAYSKKSDRGREKRIDLLEAELDNTRRLYDEAMEEFYRKDVDRDDILDAMALAVAARNRSLTSVPEGNDIGPWMRIYYPSG